MDRHINSAVNNTMNAALMGCLVGWTYFIGTKEAAVYFAVGSIIVSLAFAALSVVKAIKYRRGE